MLVIDTIGVCRQALVNALREWLMHKFNQEVNRQDMVMNVIALPLSEGANETELQSYLEQQVQAEQ